MAVLHVFLVVCSSCFLSGSGTNVGLRAGKSEAFTSNAICRQNNCVNPVFPGLYDLAKLETVAWQCANHSMVSDYVSFCGEVVNYGPALPSPNASKPVRDIVKEQDDAAATMFVYHLSGLGYEASEFREPAKSGDDCIKSIWRMVCFTYFPKAQAGCNQGQPTRYLKPCKNCCENYIQACQVECCDESVQCAFQHTVSQDGTNVEMIQTGYSDVLGPSALCTGAGRRSSAPLALLMSIFAVHALFGSFAEETVHTSRRSRKGLLVAALVAVCALALQGCTIEVPHHTVGNWRSKSDYLVSYEFVEPGKDPSTAILNSCSEGVATSLQCSGRGYCKAWSESTALAQNAVSFCECDRDWADPECRTRRKSQITSFVLSLFGGFLGLDYFYLGWPWWGVAKLCTLGGGGLWWLMDIVRTGAGPVYASDYRVAHDLPHWVFVLSTVSLFGFIGFFLAVESYMSHRNKRRHDLLKFQESEESRHFENMDSFGQPGGRAYTQPRNFAGYGAALPAQLPGCAPYAQPAQGQVGSGQRCAWLELRRCGRRRSLLVRPCDGDSG